MATVNEKEARRLMQQLLDGELQGVEAAQARVLVEAHPELAAELNAHQALQQALSGLRGADPAAGFEDRLLQRIAAEPPGLGERVLATLRRMLMPVTLATAAAAAVMLTVGAPNTSSTMARDVAAAGLLQRSAPTPVTLRLRASDAQWGAIRAALNGAGLVAPELPARQGAVWSAELNGTTEQLNAAVNALGAQLPVEVQGSVPTTGDAPVRVRVVLTGM
ncbi:MAG: hypothetical protein AB2A00_11795 [Myxococcota bacterium]